MSNAQIQAAYRPLRQARGVAVYIHWPFCKAKCPYCDFNSHVRDGVDQARWRAALLRELEHMAVQVPDRRVASIFFGGGTPSLMPPATAEALIDRVHRLWPVADGIEITLEANPTSVEANTFADFRQAGVGRVSLGVQSLVDAELRFLGRGHSAAEARRAVALAQKHFGRYSFDLIYARPGQTVQAWEAELSEALAMAGGHLSLYQLTIEENTAFHHAYAKGDFALPGEEESAALYRLTEQMMAARGLYAYEVSNYAVAGQESRHNLAYWLGEDYIGVGPGAHGRLTVDATTRSGDRASPERCPMRGPDGPQRGHHKRIATQTLKSPERWLENAERQGHALEVWQEVERRQEVEERVMMGLRLTEGIDYRRFREQTGYELGDCINRQKCDLYVAQGLLAGDAGKLQATLHGRLVLSRLTAELLS